MHPHVHRRKQGVIVRAFVREAAECAVIDDATGTAWTMTRIASEGLFAVFIPHRPEVFRYQLRATRPDGETQQFHDPYSFLPTLGDQDLYLFNEGNEHRIYEKLGAHLRVMNGVRMGAPETVDDVVRDVLGELANMIGGNLKCVLTRGIRLGMPSVVDGSDYSLRVCWAEVRERLAFGCSEGPFWVTVLGMRS